MRNILSLIKKKRSKEDSILTFKLQVHSIHYTVELKK